MAIIKLNRQKLKKFSERKDHSWATATNMAKKFLCAFDFDHTLLDANSDMKIQQAYNTYPVAEYLRVLGLKNGMVCYLHETFRFHYPKVVSKSDFHHTLNQLPLVHGLHDCIEQLHNLGGELIVVSDANNYFITHVLRHQNLLSHFSEVFANPAEFDQKGQLVIRPYMSADCKLSSKNLCKGKVLKDYVKKRKQEGQKFSFVCFAGDGVMQRYSVYIIIYCDISVNFLGKRLLSNAHSQENWHGLSKSWIFHCRYDW